MALTMRPRDLIWIFAATSEHPPSLVPLPALVASSELKLELQPVWKEDGALVREMIGFRLYTKSSVLIFSFAFKTSLVVLETETLNASFTRVTGFLLHDTKEGLIVSGQGTASSSCPWLVSIAHKIDFRFPLPWMSDVAPQHFAEADCRAFDAQDGDNRNDKSNERWIVLTRDDTKILQARTLSTSVAASVSPRNHCF